MNNQYIRVLVVVAVLIIIGVVLSLATYTVDPGKAILVVHEGKAAVVSENTGLHWKVPLFQSIIEIDVRTRSSSGTVRPKSGKDDLGARYNVFWRVADPVRYYEATQGDTGVAESKLNGALTPVLRGVMSSRDAQSYLTRPLPDMHEHMRDALEPVAGKIGIRILSIRVATANIPGTLAAHVASTMAAAVKTQIAAARAAGKAQRKKITAQAAKKSASILADAKSRVAVLTGKSQAKVAALYAPTAKKAPAFFEYFIGLESEADALKHHTRVLVLSMDSPWFETLEHSAKQKTRRKTEDRAEREKREK